MKTSKLLLLSAALLFATTSPMLATHNDASQMNPRGSQREGFWDSNGDRLHDTLTYPVRAIERIGQSLKDSPAIARDTMNGDRDLITSKGVLVHKGSR